MNEKNAINQPDNGYWFHPSEYESELGHPRLDVFLRSQPAGRFFETHLLKVPIVGRKSLETLHVNHPWTYGEKYRVAPGRVILRDRDDQEVEAFTFGSTLEIDTQDEVTVCYIKSPAPILKLSSRHSTSEYIAEEVEVILAEYRARYHEHYAEIITGMEPVSFYVACLNELVERSKHMPHYHDQIHREYSRWLSGEFGRSQSMGTLSGYNKSLADLFESK